MSSPLQTIGVKEDSVSHQINVDPFSLLLLLPVKDSVSQSIIQLLLDSLTLYSSDVNRWYPSSCIWVHLQTIVFLFLCCRAGSLDFPVSILPALSYSLFLVYPDHSISLMVCYFMLTPFSFFVCFPIPLLLLLFLCSIYVFVATLPFFVT